MRMTVAEFRGFQKAGAAQGGAGLVAAGRRKPKEMNGLERDYAHLLLARQIAGEVLWWAFEAITLHLADRTTLTMDFSLMLANGQFEMHDTKGFMREDAAVKMKVAAEQYPFRFVVVTRDKPKDGGAWRYKAYE